MTPETAKNAIVLINRVQITGAEAEIVAEVKRAIQQAAVSFAARADNEVPGGEIGRGDAQEE